MSLKFFKRILKIAKSFNLLFFRESAGVLIKIFFLWVCTSEHGVNAITHVE